MRLEVPYGKRTRCSVCGDITGTQLICVIDTELNSHRVELIGLSRSISPMFMYKCSNCQSTYSDNTTSFINRHVYGTVLEYTRKLQDAERKKE